MTKLTRANLVDGVITVCARDPVLNALVDRYGPPPLWARPANFATLARTILEQQVSLASAATLYRRLSSQIPGGFAPSAVRACGVDGLRALGVTRQKSAYLWALADAIATGTLSLPALATLSDDDAMMHLTRVHGIGRWTASIYLIMALRRPDVWPPGDLALHKAMQQHYALSVLPSSADAECMAQQWSPFRAVAARILWHSYLKQRAAGT